jgi:glycosyltransferase involved in cell wall biosynthesis
MKLASQYPPAKRGKIVVWGMLASHPYGGMTWQALHYLAGLRRLGFDVWYVEDSDRPVHDPVKFWPTLDYQPNVEYLSRQLSRVCLQDRWIFRPPEAEDECLGAANRAGLSKLYQEADAVINLCGAQELRPEHSDIRCLIYLQTDPALDQVMVAQGDREKIEELDAYHFLFTYGENLGAPDCLIPVERYNWLPTRPPVCLDWWRSANAPTLDAMFTTITNWKKSPEKDVVWKDQTWRWNKQDEWRRFIDLPARSEASLGLAIGAIDDQDQALLRSHGWQLTPATALANPDNYRDYLRNSLGEFTIAKEQYVRPRSGWFSDRSACYLAAGRPVITQDTGLGNIIPAGEGLLTFETEEEAVSAIATVNGNYARHSQAALELAREFFEAERVIAELLDRAGLM